MVSNNNIYFQQLKANLKFILIGIIILALITFGFLVALALITVIIIAIPIMRLWNFYKFKNVKNGKDKDINDFIDADYEIIESTEEKKRK